MNLNIMGPLNMLGYGRHSVKVSRALLDLGHSLTIIPIGPMQVEQHEAQWLAGCLQGSGGRCYDPTAPVVRNYHEWEMVFPPGTGPKIAWPAFEVDRIRPEAVTQLNQVNAIACSSQWIKNTLEANGVLTNKFIAHQGVDTDVFKPALSGRTDDDYRFLAVGKFEARKGHYELIRAFKTAFPSEKDVQLCMLCDNPFMKPGATGHEIAQLSQRDPRVVMLNRVASHAGVAGIINACDCGVFPTRGEGWGQPMLQVLSCAKPLIATFVTSQKDYLDDTVAREIRTEGLEAAHDGMFFHGFGRWYKPSVGSIVEQMRRAYEEKWRTNEAGRKRAEEFTWTRSAKMLIGGIEGLQWKSGTETV